MIFDDIKHAQRERLIFLDRCLTWRGVINRRDLMDRFGISPAQAALDLREYVERSREAPPVYDSTRKTYVAAPNHKALAPTTLLEAFDSVLAEDDGGLPPVLPSPQRRAEPQTMARLYQAMKAGQAVKIAYTSMTSGAAPEQWIAPTQFTSDGESVHVRAFSYKHGEFRNYLPVRIDIESSFEVRSLEMPLPFDEDWHTVARIWLRPRTDLSDAQAAAVRKEYGFEGEDLCVETRKALEFYVTRRWGLNQDGARLEHVRTDHFVSTML